jgi:hypothetical protein
MLPTMPIRNLKTVTRPMYDLHDRLHTLLHAPPATDAPLAAQPLTEQVKVFERIERGSVDRHRADPAFVEEVEQAVAQILAVLYAPLDGTTFVVPRDVWTRSPLTKLLASVTYWLYQDELISMADASRLLYNDAGHTARARVRRMIERGTLRHYWRPGRTDPTNAVLVRRSEVEQVQQHQHEE